MNYKNLYSTELNNPNTKFFILDTKGSSAVHDDVDFVRYSWRTSKFGLVKPGDLFIYRRPGKASETGKFYFFGAGKIEDITPSLDISKKNNDKTSVNGTITKPYPFINNIHPEELEKFNWHFKEKQQGSWGNFFNQYGMNKIAKEDFVSLMELAENDIKIDYDNNAATEALQNIQTKNYYVDDIKSESTRRSKQIVFSNTVKNNYRNKCAICGINTKTLLIGSHIIPWATRKDIRLDPTNGISLCVMHDKLFDAGYITFDSQLKIIVTEIVNNDPSLKKITDLIKGDKLCKPKSFPPNQEYLEYHRKKIFEKFLKI